MNNTANSGLNHLIPPEIKDDELYNAIQRIAREENIKTVLEIGSSSGEGSTEALVTGIRENPNQPTLFCIEISRTRFSALQKRYANDSFVKNYNGSSISLKQFPEETEIIEFYNETKNMPKGWNSYPIEQVLTWLHQDVEFLKNSGVPENVIKIIKQENKIDFFDLVIIDGSEFTGSIELNELYGARFIVLDDINTFKNYNNYYRLIADKNYILFAQNKLLRNGYAIFKKIDVFFNKEKSEQLLVKKNASPGMTNFDILIQNNYEYYKTRNNGEKILTLNSFYDNYIAFPSLPVHIFTIVLNGEPFIRYHIEVFNQLPFKWHWHIIEGVADLKHDTAWVLRYGGRIINEMHCNGRSNDGTTEYLDELAQQYPDNVTVYRKPEGIFWDGKLEMVNAPLANINEECLLWQVDADELWTVDQICKVRQLFISNPDKTAAFYWCWYFVGEDLVISTRNCYAQNPNQEWLRTWKYKAGDVWIAHEPPRLAESLPNGQLRDVAGVNPFLHEETEKEGLVFQHFAYVTPKQLQFKEQYYGYANALSRWTVLQEQRKFPVLLREYFPWVHDTTQVETAEFCGVTPIAKREEGSSIWQFIQPEQLPQQALKSEKISPIIIVDGVFFQLYKTGIARVWKSLLEEWADNGFSKHIIVLDRGGTAPAISGIRYHPVPFYNYKDLSGDRAMLQRVCDEEAADLFMSTYYTTPLSTPSVLMVHDMIPEIMDWDLEHPHWRGKHHAIEQASSYVAVSENTAHDLIQFFPQISPASVKVAHNGVKTTFSRATSEEFNQFKIKYGIAKPYFILVGAGSGYKNSMLFFKAFAKLSTKQGFDIVCTGSGSLLEADFRPYSSGSVVHMLQLSDEELKAAYSGAVALVYPSKYEGFGLPVLEAIACGCPVITCPNASIPEVAGDAALYVNDEDVEGLANALCEVQKPSVRQSLITTGLQQAKKFSWSKMAGIVSSVLIDTTLQFLNLNDINFIIFPDWSVAEESLSLDLEQVISIIATHPDKSRITLLIDTSDISEEDANLLLSSVAMNLLMQEDLDVTSGAEISLIGELGKMQWKALLESIRARLILEHENKKVIAQMEAGNILSYKIDSTDIKKFILSPARPVLNL